MSRLRISHGSGLKRIANNSSSQEEDSKGSCHGWKVGLVIVKEGLLDDKEDLRDWIGMGKKEKQWFLEDINACLEDTNILKWEAAAFKMKRQENSQSNFYVVTIILSRKYIDKVNIYIIWH